MESSTNNTKIEGEIIEVEMSTYWGQEVGIVECPVCQTQVPVSPMSDRTCRCGIKWDFECRAVGKKPL